MKYLLIILLLVGGAATAQTTYNIRADTTKLEKVGGNNDLVLKNSTRSRTGAYLKNISNGITGFFYAIDSAWMSTDSTLVVRRGDGNDTLLIRGSGISTTPGLQDVITQDPVFTLDKTIDLGLKQLLWQQNVTTNQTSIFGIYAEINESGTATLSDPAVGKFVLNVNGSGAVGGSNASMVRARLTADASADLRTVTGFHFDPVATTAGAQIDFFEGVSIDAWQNEATIGDLAAFYYGGVSNNTGTINNHYGLFIDTMVTAGTTNTYAIYTKNGDVRLGALPTGAATDSIMTWEASTGIVRKRNVASITGVNIYNSDGTLTGERVVDMGGNLLNFLNGGVVVVHGTTTTNQSYFAVGSNQVRMRGGIADGSGVDAYYDSVRLTPRLGVLKIDTLTFVPGTKELRYNPSTGLVSYADTSTAAGGGTPAGNFGNVQINRNGAFATPGSDSLDFDGGLVVKGSVTSSTLTDGRVLIGGASGLIRDYAALTYDGMNLLNTTTGGASTGITITSTNASSYSSMNFVTTLGGNGFQIGKYGPTGSVANGVFFYNPDNSPTVFTQNNNRILDITGAGNLLLGGTTDPASAYYTIGLHNGGAPTGSITNGVIIYSEDVAASAELKVRDEAGNITVLSPHNFTGIPMGKSEDMAWSYYSERDGKYITVDMLKAIRTIEKLTVRVAELEKRLGVEPTKPTKLVYKGKVKVKQPVPINKNK